MKTLIAALSVALFVVGCSKKEANGTAAGPTTTATDLGKDANYFSNLYGPANSQKSVSDFDFTLPTVSHLIKLNEPFVIQQYANGKLNVTVMFGEGSPQAIWVKYTISNPWTQEQLEAALGAYDNKWSAITINTGVTALGEAVMKSMVPDLGPSTFQSHSGILAYKTIGGELIMYSPALFHDLSQKVADEEQQKREVPKF